MADVYKVYDKPPFTVTFSVDGVAEDPEIAIFGLKDPSGNSEVYTYGEDAEVERVSKGIYRVYYLLDEPGVWDWVWIASSTDNALPSGVDQGSINVSRLKVDVSL